MLGFKTIEEWPLEGFEHKNYHLRVYGPNGFYREFIGDNNTPALEVSCRYEKAKKITGNVALHFANTGQQDVELEIIDNAYGNPVLYPVVAANQKNKTVLLNLKKSANWYDFTVKLKNKNTIAYRFAGHVETGEESITDPAMGNRG
ncbi:phospholipase domain-containing protein [Niabella hibiscisoli]|uniref:phospholipase domain-containing protein n=1 Tax=Niabella hibiscisoli TaxID=1825928 RepID=UPI001F0FBE11|nr:phospholipase domain-containing protein [Niabella hibiscisoli]MCH5717924.1 DUF756 domain-containing protein [Niabella hibiscisoli]